MTDRLTIHTTGRVRGVPTRRNGLGPDAAPKPARVTHEVTWTDATGKHNIARRTKAAAFEKYHELKRNGFNPRIALLNGTEVQA